jgi:hypothetical protein
LLKRLIKFNRMLDALFHRLGPGIAVVHVAEIEQRTNLCRIGYGLELAVLVREAVGVGNTHLPQQSIGHCPHETIADVLVFRRTTQDSVDPVSLIRNIRVPISRNLFLSFVEAEHIQVHLFS